MGEDAVQAERSSMASGHESQELLVPSPSPTHGLSELGLSEPGIASDHSVPAPAPDSDGPPRDGVSPTCQVNAITVLTLLDKLVNMLDTVQENQHKMEQRQAEMEGAVRGIQNDMTKLSKSHSSTANTVSKLMEKSRKVSVHMKEVKDKMDKQAGQVKRLEANHAHLLQRNNFKVLIFQEENEIPTSVFVKDPPPFPYNTENQSLVIDANRSQEEGLQTIQLSSDEEFGLDEEDDEEDSLAAVELMEEHMEKSRAEKIKRSSLKKVDSLKKAFSRQNIEKKMNKIVSAEKREKIKKSLTPSHQKNPSGKSSSFKVSPLTFGIKKTKEGEAEVEKEAEAEVEVEVEVENTSSAVATIELCPILNTEQDLSFSQVHSQLAPCHEEVKAAVEAMEKEEMFLDNSAELNVSVSEGVSEEYALSSTLPQDAYHVSVSHNVVLGEEEEEDDEQKERDEAGQAESLVVE